VPEADDVGLPVLRFTEHARRRAVQRGIAQGAVQRAVRDHQVRVVRIDGKVDYHGEVDSVRLKVVVDESTDPWEVITVFALEEG
jgi:hypothetical protein